MCPETSLRDACAPEVSVPTYDLVSERQLGELRYRVDSAWNVLGASIAGSTVDMFAVNLEDTSVVISLAATVAEPTYHEWERCICAHPQSIRGVEPTFTYAFGTFSTESAHVWALAARDSAVSYLIELSSDLTLAAKVLKQFACQFFSGVTLDKQPLPLAAKMACSEDV